MPSELKSTTCRLEVKFMSYYDMSNHFGIIKTLCNLNFVHLVAFLCYFVFVNVTSLCCL